MSKDPEELPDAPEATSSETQPVSKKRKNPNPTPTTQFSIRNPTHAYVHLQHLSPNPKPQPLDTITASMHLTAALSAFLGLHGSAILFDILKLEGQDVWIRVQAEDRAAVVAATGGWVSQRKEGWRVSGWSYWDAEAAGKGKGEDLFED